MANWCCNGPDSDRGLDSSREIGAEFTSNPIVRKITFTGSTEIGKLLIEQCAATVKKMSMELGGD